MENQSTKVYGIKTRDDGKRDALQGVINYLHTHYHVNWDVDQVNYFMKQYRLDRGSIPSWRHSKNAQYCQRAFGEFVKYCKLHLKKKKLVR